jgi:predicted acetyltransferase
MTLLEAWKLGLDDILLTCDSDNVGSRRIVERNGGQLWSEGPTADTGKLVARYWIHRSPEVSPISGTSVDPEP